MGRSTYEQTCFVGGEVSPLAQGRSDLPWYRQALSLSLNGVTVEEGSWVRRSGFKFIAPTRGRTYGKLIGFDGSATCSFAMCFTNENLQFFTVDSLIFNNTVAYITASGYQEEVAGVLDIELNGDPGGWEVGDQVALVFPDISSPLYPYPIAQECNMRGRLLTINYKISGTQYGLATDLGGQLGIDYVTNGCVGAQIMKVLNITTPYDGTPQLEDLRAVQIEYQSVILSQGTAPYVVQITTQGTDTTDPTFSFEELTFVDGPYLDPSGDTGTVSATSGTITFTASTTTPFVSTDVGRHLRLFSQPAAWNPSTTYSIGDNVTDSSGAWWTSIINSNTDYTPGQAVTIGGVQQLAWAPAPTAGSWAWGIISAVNSSSEVTLTLDTTIPNMVLQSANGDTIFLFQLGVFGNTPAPGTTTPCFPTCGLWGQGRLWLGGAVVNRFDTTISNGINEGIATFSPTDPYDNVNDSNGISEIMNSSYVANIQWMIAEDAGILMGTLNGEFLIFSSETNDPITPTNIDSRMISKFGDAFIEPVRAGMATLFVQKYQRRLMEYLADAFSGKFSGRHLNEWAKHLATAGISQIAYQEETWPCVWAIMNNGLLTSCTYRRFSRFVNEPPTIEAWSRHLHGRQRSVTSMCVIPGKNGLLDALFTATNDPVAVNQPAVNNYFVEILQPLFDEGQTSLEGWFCDEAPGPSWGNSGYDCGGGNVTIFGKTGGIAGSDTTTPDVGNTFPYSDNGASPAVGQPLNLDAEVASYLDGNTTLYMLPPFPQTGGAADESSLSMSVWVASEDYPIQAGALFSTPCLSEAEVVAGTTNVTSVLIQAPASGGCGPQPAADLFRSTVGNPDTTGGHGAAAANDGGALAGGQTWNNLMISMRSNGDGTVTVTAAMNETVILSAVSTGNMANDNPIFPFSTQPGGVKDNGAVCVWAIGGINASVPAYNETSTYLPGGKTESITIPTLAQIVQALFQNIPTVFGGPGYKAGQGFQDNIALTTANLTALPAYFSYMQNLQAQMASQASVGVTANVLTPGNASGNLAFDQPDGTYTGYRGSVAELLIWPGQFIDWTSSTNRAYVHYFDSVEEQYRPCSVGPKGAGTALGAPYVYLSGPPSLFSTNRAATQPYALTVSGTGVIESPLDPP